MSTSSRNTNSMLGKFLLRPHEDIILRSGDSHDFPVLKHFIVDNSPILGEQIMATTFKGAGPEATVNGETLLPVIRLPEDHTIISSLLTFLFPVPPILPPSREQTLKLLSVAQKYQMTIALTRIRHDTPKPEFFNFETALQEYSLAWKYGLLEETLLAAKETIKWPMTLDVFKDRLNVVPLAALIELWRYRRRVLDNLNLSLASDFFLKNSDVHKIIAPFECVEHESESGTPLWLSNYLDSVVKDRALLDITTFSRRLFTHTVGCQYCRSISDETIRGFWAALTACFHQTIKRSESDFSLTPRETPYQSSTLATTGAEPLQKVLNMQGADVILQSSDCISFRVHKLNLALSSSFFDDLFSLPQPPDGENIDGLPVVHVPEDAEVLHSLLTLVYPFYHEFVMPTSYEQTFALLAALEKYSMDKLSSTVRRAMVLPTTEAAFRAYAIASSKGLIPEMEATARLTLDHPMTFEVIVDVLPMFEGSALHDLLGFRERCRLNLQSFFISFFDGKDSLSEAWNVCYWTKYPHFGKADIARWFADLVSQKFKNLQEPYACPLPNSSTLRKEYDEALDAHIAELKTCNCVKLYSTVKATYRDEWLRRLTKARDEEPFRLDSDTKASASSGALEPVRRRKRGSALLHGTHPGKKRKRLSATT